MTQELFMQTDGLRALALAHADVVEGLSGLAGSAGQAAGVETTHGNIAAAVHSALGGTLDARHDSVQGVLGTGTTLEESLRKAAHHYEAANEGAAERLRAAGETVGGAGGRGGGAGGGAAGAPGAAASSPAGTGGREGFGSAGQGHGQMGQVGGQLAQAVSGLGQGLSHGLSQGMSQGMSQGGSQLLSQLPQQLIQGIAQAAGKGGGHAGLVRAEETSVSRDEAAPGESAAASKAPERVTLARETSPKPDRMTF